MASGRKNQLAIVRYCMAEEKISSEGLLTNQLTIKRPPKMQIAAAVAAAPKQRKSPCRMPA